MPELVKIPISFFELTIDYEPLWTDLGTPFIRGVFDALKPWNPKFADLEILSTGKLSEQGFNLRLPLERVGFFFGYTLCKFTREDADWPSKDKTIAILDAAVAALIELSGVKVVAKKASIAIHFQPQHVPFAEILRPFVARQIETLEAEPMMTMAIVARWQNRKVTLDGSATLANGIFLKLERDFAGTVTSDEIADQIRKDEEELLCILGVEEIQG